MGTMNFMAQAVGPSTTYGANLQFRRQVELLVVIPPKQMFKMSKMLAGQSQDGVHALITELKTMFFKSKGYFIIFFVCADEQKRAY